MSKISRNQDVGICVALGEKKELTAQPLNNSTSQLLNLIPLLQRSPTLSAYPSTHSEMGHYCRFLPLFAGFGSTRVYQHSLSTSVYLGKTLNFDVKERMKIAARKRVQKNKELPCTACVNNALLLENNHKTV
jgi:hypothetical protein